MTSGSSRSLRAAAAGVLVAAGGRELHRVLLRGGVEHERPQPLRVRLLQHEHPAHVRVVDDRHPGRGLVGLPGQVGALHAALGELERVEVAGGQGLDRLAADQHPRVLDDHEHLPDAVVHAADQGADRGQARVAAEGQLAGRGDLEAHLVLEVGDLSAVALAERAVLIHQVLGHQEHRQALGAGPGALRPGEHQVEDVLRHVLLAVGDEPLDALDVPGAVGLLDRLGPAGAHVGAGVRLGQHHGRAPPALDRELGEALLLGGAERPQDRSRTSARCSTSRRPGWRRG